MVGGSLDMAPLRRHSSAPIKTKKENGMKKTLMVLLLLSLLGAVAAADGINLGDFPLGKWMDPNYDAVWEFSSNNIRILSPSGEVYCDFSQKEIQDFKVGLEGGKPVITFSSEETRRSYKITKPLANMNVILEIDAPWNRDYKVEMKKQ